MKLHMLGVSPRYLAIASFSGGVSQQNGSDDRTEHAVDGPSTDDKRADVSDKGSKKCAEEELKGGSEIINGSTSN